MTIVPDAILSTITIGNCTTAQLLNSTIAQNLTATELQVNKQRSYCADCLSHLQAPHTGAPDGVNLKWFELHDLQNAAA
jgi:hypothetical protein